MSNPGHDEPYVYKPLPAGDYFRYLTLEPGSGDEPLRCGLHTYRIGKATYEALSYVWGSEIRDQRIYCDGHVLHITSNLFDALRRLRSPNHMRELWADSICINQEDDEEKGYQVSNMGRIYSNASCVLIYVGLDPDDHGPKVASLLDAFQDLFQREMKGSVSYSWNSFPELSGDTLRTLLGDMRWHSLRALLYQPWFDRGWVVREAGLAKHCRILWGESELNWTMLMWTTTWIQTRTAYTSALSRSDLSRLATHFDTYWDRYHHQLRIFYPFQRWEPVGLLYYLACGRWLQFKDRRDGIYAFLDLTVKPTAGLTLTPDYTVPLQKVFRDFAVDYLHTTGDATILGYVMHSTDSLQAHLPSWVPRWTEIKQWDDSEEWRAIFADTQKSTNYNQPEVIDARLLKVHGIILDTVGFVSDVLYESTLTLRRVYQLWKDIQNWTSEARPDVQYRSMDFIDTLAHDRLPDDVVQKLEYIKGVERTEGVAQDDDALVIVNNLPASCVQIQTRIRRHSNAKTFMVSRKGHLGLAPAIAEKGDILARLYGSTSLPGQYVYVLRATNQPNHFKLVGPAWTYRGIPEETERTKHKEDASGQGESSDPDDCKGEYTLGIQDIYLC